MNLTRLKNHLSYLVGLSTACCLAIGMVRFSWEYQDSCLDHRDNFSLVIRNLFCVGLFYFVLNFFKDSWNKIQDNNLLAWILCRYMLIYTYVPQVVRKIMKVYYQYSYTAANERIMNVEPRNLMWQVYSSSDSYEIVIGVAQLLIVLMLTFRRTTPIAGLLLLPIAINNLAMGYLFDSCYILNHISYLAMNLGVVIFTIPILVEWVAAIQFRKLLAFEGERRKHILGIIAISKMIVLIGFLMQSLWQVDRSKNYYRRQVDHPLIGIWKVDTIMAKTDNFPKFDKMIFEKSIVGNVAIQDSQSMFYYIVDTTYNQMEFYNFQEFRTLDLKGKYNFLDSTTVEYIGRNNKDSLQIILKKIEPVVGKEN